MRLSAQSQVVFRVSTKNVAGDVNFKPDEWRVFALVDGRRNIADIAQQLGIDAKIVYRIAESLFYAGLLELGPGETLPAEIVPDKFFQQLTRQLTLVLGALAEIIIDEELAAMKQMREVFPQSRAAELVERVSLNIRDDRRRLEFQQIMLDELRRL